MPYDVIPILGHLPKISANWRGTATYVGTVVECGHVMECRHCVDGSSCLRICQSVRSSSHPYISRFVFKKNILMGTSSYKCVVSNHCKLIAGTKNA